jgi:histidine triad (HIT) family protein
MEEEDCIFCKIAAGKMAAHKVYEDNDVIAILDINPVNPGHTLVIPKEHTEYFEEMGGERYNHVMNIVQRIARTIKKTYNPPRVGLLVWGFEVPHTHVHVVPLKEPGDFSIKRMPKPSDEDLDKVAAELDANI